MNSPAPAESLSNPPLAAGGSSPPVPTGTADSSLSAWVRSILEAAEDGICVTAPDHSVTDHNRRFIEMWGLTEESVRGSGQETIRDAIGRQVVDPDGFFERTVAILNSSEPDTTDLIQLRNGRVFERHSRLQIVEGRVVGRVWSFRDVTEQRRAEEALQRQEAELRALADSMAQLAWMAEPDGHIFWYNRRWFEYTGTTLEQMRGWGWQAVHEPSMVSQVVRRWGRAIQTGTPFEMEFPLRGADGVYRWFLTRAIPVTGEGGRVVRWFGTSTDIDRAKRAEDALREETRALELLNRTGAAISSQLDLEGVLQTVTRAGTELSGARHGTFFLLEPGSGAAPDEFVPRAGAGAPSQELTRASEGRRRFLSGVFRGREPLRREDAAEELAGADLPPTRSYLAVPVVSRSGEVLGGLFFGHPERGAFDARAERVLAGMAAQAAIAIDNARLYEAAQRDLAARARSERRLRESETRLRVALEMAALGAWALDVKSGIVELDDRCLELFGTTARGAMSLQEFVALAHPDQRAERREALRRLCAGETERYDMEFRAPDGERWLKSGAKPVRDCKGEVTAVIGGVLDITEAVRARATNEDRQRELERLVEERTGSLHQAIAQMEEFSYSVSHDLRAPLRAIQGYAQAVIEDCGDKIGGKSMEHLSRILAAGKRMDRLTLDVLTYSRIARGDAPLSRLSLERLVDDVIEQYAPDSPRPGSIRVERPLLDVLGHESLLAQAISNLLVNAMKFVPDGVRPEVRVWTERRDAQVRLWIEDNGIGVQPEHRARIWGMFERVHPPDKYEGTGIGLAIVRKAVERMGGGVGVESEPGRGSRFWIQLQAA